MLKPIIKYLTCQHYINISNIFEVWQKDIKNKEPIDILKRIYFQATFK